MAALIAAVLAAGLASDTTAWGTLAVLLAATFAWNERWATDPILPPCLFANRSFVVTSAVGFVTGLALYGSVTYLLLYLQVVRGLSPSRAGPELTPMMAGAVLSSTVSGRLVSRTERYKPFPIIGTATTAGASPARAGPNSRRPVC
jgi:hypothetical protein